MDHNAHEKFVGNSFSVAKGESFTTQSVLLSATAPSSEMGEDQIDCLESIAQLLNGLLITNDTATTDCHCCPLGSVNAGSKFDVEDKTLFNYAMEDYTVLR